jgi:hypothetical protein
MRGYERERCAGPTWHGWEAGWWVQGVGIFLAPFCSGFWGTAGSYGFIDLLPSSQRQAVFIFFLKRITALYYLLKLHHLKVLPEYSPDFRKIMKS